MPEATTRYTTLKSLVTNGLGQKTTAQFNRLFDQNGSESTASLFDIYLTAAGNLFAKAHPDGWSWQHVVKTFDVATSTTHTYAVTHSLEIIGSGGTAGAVWSTTPVPKDMGFYNVMARTAVGAAGGAVTRGDYIPLQRIDYLEAIDMGLLNRDTYVPGKVQQYWWTARNGYTFTFETAPYTLEAVSSAATCACVEFYLPFRRELPTIGGTGALYDSALIWPELDDLVVALLARALCAAQLQNWELWRGSLEQALMMIRGRLSDIGIQKLGLDFERVLWAKDEVVSGG